MPQSRRTSTPTARWRVRGVLGVAAAAALLVSATPAGAFSISEHESIHQNAWSWVPSAVLSDMRDEHLQADTLSAADSAVHFDGCNFTGGTARIRREYTAALGNLDPGDLNMWQATDELGFLAHPMMDLYSHSNWVELGRTDLIDSGLGAFRPLSPWTTVSGDVVAVQGSLPAGWSASRASGSKVPQLTSPLGTRHRGLITGTFGPNSCPNSLELGHGDLNKDGASRAGFTQARALAVRQLQHEWCRTMNLVKAAHGHAGTSLPMTLWVRPGAAPHPAGTACAPPAYQGSQRVTVTLTRIKVTDDTDPWGSGELNFALGLYTGDLRRSARTTAGSFGIGSGSTVSSSRFPAPVSLCVGAGEQVVVALHGWDDDEAGLGGGNATFQSGDEVVQGAARSWANPAAAVGTWSASGPDLDYTVSVRVSAC